MTEFFRFPHTPHLAWLGTDSPREDKVLSRDEASHLLQSEVVVEEKMDGANLGIFLDDAGNLQLQNRGSILEPPFGGQFAPLQRWLDSHAEALFDALEPNLIAFGEWCAARHSLDYDALPDWWLVFDLYDRRAGKFWSSSRRNQWARTAALATVPTVFKGKTSLSQLRRMLDSTASEFREGTLEGLMLRRESALWLLDRAKLVRSDFTQAINTHWRRRAVEWNSLAK